MTKDDIIKLAREAGGQITAFINYDYGEDVAVFYLEDLDSFANLVAAAEREECAALAEKTICDKHIPTGVSIYGTRAAKAIRARTTP